MNPSIKIQSLPTDQFEDRDNAHEIDTIIIHSMYNPEVEDKYSAESCKAILEHFGVSAHYLIDTEGTIFCLVAEDKKAWHAGVSCMPDPDDGREGVNAFSIGIELIGTEEDDFPGCQYDALVALTEDIMARRPIKNIYGHSDIAPGRKTDPWMFDWPRYRRAVTAFAPDRKIKFPV